MDLKSRIREVPNFPKEGVLFYDITTLLNDASAFHRAIDRLATFYQGEGIQRVVSVESRGFIIGAPIAYRLEAGFVPVRKPGKLPAETYEVAYQLEYGSGTLAIHKDAIAPGDRVLIVDDLLATGGTAAAVVKLVQKLGGVIVGIAFLVELTWLKGREKLDGYHVLSLVGY